jgi:hypothetical protein
MIFWFAPPCSYRTKPDVSGEYLVDNVRIEKISDKRAAVGYSSTLMIEAIIFMAEQ